MTMQKRRTARNQRILDLLNEGRGVAEIAREMRVHRITVLRIGKRLGWRPRPYSGPERQTERNEMIRAAVRDNARQADVARAFQLTRQRVHDIVHERRS